MNIIVRINTYFLKRHFVDKKNNHDYRLQNIYLFIKEHRCNLHLLLLRAVCRPVKNNPQF